jgi:phosphogluconate dehydratase
MTSNDPVPQVALNPVVAAVTARLVERSRASRARYLARMRRAAQQGPGRAQAGCANLAHAFAACEADDKQQALHGDDVHLAIVTAYNDMLSAHQPFEGYPQRIRAAARRAGATAQVAGGVPAMCDGVTQGRSGMELSLFSRDVIAMSTGVALSHDVFGAALCLGVCDKIVPGMLIGALSFGHLPFAFVPAGPMRSGLSNEEKAEVRRRHATGEASRAELQAAEAAAYHGAGTCTFYGTANSNQMLMEIMGLHLPGASFVNPGTALRDALTDATVERVIVLARDPALAADGTGSLARIIDERAIVNGVIGLHATGGSTNHLLHLVAMAAAAGIELVLDDFSDLSRVVPLLARVYPNGKADVNHFHAAGGMAFVIGELLDAGLLHGDANTIMGPGLARYRTQPVLLDGRLDWVPGARTSLDASVLRGVAAPFAAQGGLTILHGSLGTAAIKISAVAPEHRIVEAPAIVFEDPDLVPAAFRRGELDRDFVAVVRFQGPRANGMPELHQLTPILSVLQQRGFKVALVTDGRMSGASGKVPAAIHLAPEALAGGPLAQLVDGDVIRLDAEAGTLDVLVPAAEFARRPRVLRAEDADDTNGRDMFALFRSAVGPSDRGASVFNSLATPGTGP